MDILSLSRTLRAGGLGIFTTADLAALLPGEDRRLLALQLHHWNRKGWVIRLRRGVYELAWPDRPVISDPCVANRLYGPSYVSLETALSRYQIVPEVAAQVTSVTALPTRRFLTPRGLFTYFSVRPGAYAGYRVMAEPGGMVLFAEPEKAVVDRLYAALRRGEPLGGVTDRWDRAALRRLNRRKMAAHARLFGRRAPWLERRCRALL